MRKARILTVLFFLFFVYSRQLLCQQNSPDQTASQGTSITTFKVSSRLVVLDVVVTDKNHQPVSGLKKDDFTVLEDGRAQRIRSFESATEHVVPRNVNVNSTDDLRKARQAPVTVLVVDEMNTSFEDAGYSRYSLKKFLNAQPAKLLQPTALMIMTSRHFEVLHDFTQDRNALLTTLDKHFPEIPWRLVQRNGAEAGERLAISLNVIQQIAHAYSGHPGRKNLIWLGRGFPSVSVQDLPADDAQRVTDAVQRTINTLLDAHVALYTIDPTPNTSSVNDTSAILDMLGPNDISILQDASGQDPFQDDVNFGLIAPASGGRVFRSLNSVDAEIGSSVSDGGNYYTLAYSPSNKSDQGQQYRHISIQINRPGLIATTRTGYYAKTSPAAEPSAETQPTRESRQLLTLDLSSAAESKMAYIGLPVTVEKSSQIGKFNVRVDTKALTWSDLPDGDRQAEVTVLSVALDKKNKFLTHHAFEMAAYVKADDASKSLEQTANFLVTADIPTGATRVRFVVRDAATGHIGSADLDPVTLQQKH